MARKEVQLAKIKGDKNGADLLTKVGKTAATIEQHLNRLQQWYKGGHAQLSKTIHGKNTKAEKEANEK